MNSWLINILTDVMYMATFRVKKTKSGEERIHVTIRIKGYPTLGKVFSNMKDAEVWAKKTETSIKNPTTNIPSIPLSIWLDRYEIDFLPKKSDKMKEAETRHISFWKQHLGKKIAIEISSHEIQQTADLVYLIISHKTKKAMSPESRRKYINTLQYIYNIAIKQWNWCSINPCFSVDKLNKEIREHRDKSKEIITQSNDSFKLTKRKFIERILDKNLKISQLMNKSGLTKTSVQTLLDPEANVTLLNMVKILDSLDITMEFK